MNAQTALFGEGGAVAAEPERIRRDPYNEYLREKFNLPAEWAWWEVTCREDSAPAGFYRFKGSVAPLKKNGRRDYRREDKATVRVLFLDVADWRAWEEARGARLNECPKCYGEGLEGMGWTQKDGRLTRPCSRCDATGRYRALPTTEAER